MLERKRRFFTSSGPSRIGMKTTSLRLVVIRIPPFPVVPQSRNPSTRSWRGRRGDSRWSRIRRPVAEQAADGREDGEEHALRPDGRERERVVVQVRAADHGRLQEVRHALRVRLAVAGEGVDRLEELAEAPGRLVVDERADRAVALELVGGPARDRQLRRGGEHALGAPEREADGALLEIPALLDLRMLVRRRRGPLGRHLEAEERRRRVEKRDGLARLRIADHLAGVRHQGTPYSGYDGLRPKSRAIRARIHHSGRWSAGGTRGAAISGANRSRTSATSSSGPGRPFAGIRIRRSRERPRNARK